MRKQGQLTSFPDKEAVIGLTYGSAYRVNNRRVPGGAMECCLTQLFLLHRLGVGIYALQEARDGV